MDRGGTSETSIGRAFHTRSLAFGGLALATSVGRAQFSVTDGQATRLTVEMG